jgi:hypothetical protein
MIRRGFWLAAGATLGVMGYRRATRLARELGFGVDGQPAAGRTRQPDEARQVRAGGNLIRRRAPARHRGVVASVASAALFVRDVREGMAEYWSLHRGELARTLGSRSDRIASGGPGAGEQRRSGH